MQPGCEVFNVADQEAFSFAQLAVFIAEACAAPAPRSVPWFAAACLARLGDAIEAVAGRGFVLDSRRLRTLTEDAVFPADKLFETGFAPVEATRDGIAEMARFVKSQDRLAT
jgi:nucleoside-diphosphate-sugar epimerase